MKLTDLFKFKLFERKDVADLAVVNENFQAAESEIDKRLLKTAVQNTNTVTEAGYALDARQANPNVKGSLAELIAALNSKLTNVTDELTFKGGSIGYASDMSLEAAINKFIDNMSLYVPYVIHGDNISGVPISTTPNDVCIEVIVLNKATKAYRIVLYDNKNTDIYTISRIDAEWKTWCKLTS